jgi:stalled ribosome rescue protein Dom34
MAIQTGIWIDKREAKIITLKEHKSDVMRVESEVESFRPKGGSGSKQKGGPQDVVQDSKYLERKKHQLKNYFRNIIPHIKDADEIVVFGPALTGKQFVEELREQHATVHQKVREVVKADSMTTNQAVAWTKDFFTKG